jgi:drug/metabolite transporter (DMT)-like permease
MNAKLIGLLFVLGSVTSEAFSHVAWKLAADAGPAGGGGAARVLWAAVRQYKMIGLGVALFIVQAATWTLAIRYLKDLSLAYPASSLEYIAVVLLARVMLKEKVAARRWLGAALIVAGTALVLVQ